MILLCSISCSDLNGRVDGGADIGDSLEFTTCRHLLCKIRFEAPMGHWEREEDVKDAEVNL